MINGFTSGIGAYAKAIAHVRRYGLWGYVLVPGILTVLIAVGVFGAAWVFSDEIGEWLANLWRWDWGRSVAGQVADILGGILVFLLGLIVFKQLVMIITAPIMSILSEKVEGQLLGEKVSRPFTLSQVVSDVLRGLRIAVRNLVRELSLTLVLIVLSLIPLLSPFTAVGIFIVQAYYAGFGNLDFALERKFNYADSVRYVGRHRGMAIGNGAVYLLFLFSFIGFLVAIPLATVAATIAVVENSNPTTNSKSR